MVRGPLSQVLPQGTGGTPICSKSPLAGEHNRGLEFRLLLQLMIHLGRRNLPFLSTSPDKRLEILEKANSAKVKGVPYGSIHKATRKMKGTVLSIPSLATTTATVR